MAQALPAFSLREERVPNEADTCRRTAML